MAELLNLTELNLGKSEKRKIPTFLIPSTDDFSVPKVWPSLCVFPSLISFSFCVPSFSFIWMTSRTQWTWVWVNSGRWWWTGRPGMLRFMGSQRVGHNWATELNWITIRSSRFRFNASLFMMIFLTTTLHGISSSLVFLDILLLIAYFILGCLEMCLESPR